MKTIRTVNALDLDDFSDFILEHIGAEPEDMSSVSMDEARALLSELKRRLKTKGGFWASTEGDAISLCEQLEKALAS